MTRARPRAPFVAKVCLAGLLFLVGGWQLTEGAFIKAKAKITQNSLARARNQPLAEPEARLC